MYFTNVVRKSNRSQTVCKHGHCEKDEEIVTQGPIASFSLGLSNASRGLLHGVEFAQVSPRDQSYTHGRVMTTEPTLSDEEDREMHLKALEKSSKWTLSSERRDFFVRG